MGTDLVIKHDGKIFVAKRRPDTNSQELERRPLIELYELCGLPDGRGWWSLFSLVNFAIGLSAVCPETQHLGRFLDWVSHGPGRERFLYKRGGPVDCKGCGSRKLW